MTKFIERKPPKEEHPRIVFNSLEELEEYLQSTKGWAGFDLYNLDLSRLDFSSKKGQELLSGINQFDDQTTWSEALAKEKAYQLKRGKDSGLGISQLHKKGFTGKGINIAIIDQCLLVDHPEYQENLKYYKEFGNERLIEKRGELPGGGRASYHGPAVASLAVGKNCGSAPEAGLYFLSKGWRHSPMQCSEAIKHLIELNKKLPEKDKIRCLSCSWGRLEDEGHEERMKLFKELEETGCMVFGGFYGGPICGRRHSGGSKIHPDSDSLDNLKAEDWVKEGIEDLLIVPEHQRTFASSDGGYLYGEQGGASWTYPYLAGLVACGLQANPEILKQKDWQNKVWQKLLETARSTPDHRGRIVQPEAFVESMQQERELASKTLKKTLEKGCDETIKMTKQQTEGVKR